MTYNAEQITYMLAEAIDKDREYKSWHVSTKHLMTLVEMVVAEEREKSLKLWMLLDDIDTADDIAKTDHDTYRRLCRNTQQKRWAVLSESEVDAAIRARGQA
jgi:hypothetical protein